MSMRASVMRARVMFASVVALIAMRARVMRARVVLARSMRARVMRARVASSTSMLESVIRANVEASRSIRARVMRASVASVTSVRASTVDKGVLPLRSAAGTARIAAHWSSAGTALDESGGNVLKVCPAKANNTSGISPSSVELTSSLLRSSDCRRGPATGSASTSAIVSVCSGTFANAVPASNASQPPSTLISVMRMRASSVSARLMRASVMSSSMIRASVMRARVVLLTSIRAKVAPARAIRASVVSAVVLVDAVGYAVASTDVGMFESGSVCTPTFTFAGVAASETLNDSGESSTAPRSQAAPDGRGTLR